MPYPSTLLFSALLLLGSAIVGEPRAEADTETLQQHREQDHKAVSTETNHRQIPDFRSIKDRTIRKRAFIQTITEHARPILHRIEKERTVLLSLYLRYRSGDELTSEEQRWILELATIRKVTKFDSDNEKRWTELLRRTDGIPLSLIIAQGALESAWGTSRFAREGNNYFGIWCFKPGCGMVPVRRDEGATHEVEKYPDLTAAIEKYIHILNTRSAFEELRVLRHQQRLNLLTPSGTFLLKGLGLYAKNGEEYMTLVEKIITQNRLGQYD